MKLTQLNTASVLLFAIAATAVSSTALADAARGLEIATAVDQQNEGFVDTTSTMQMTLINRSGKKSERKMRALTLEVPGDGDKSMSIFDQPADVRGTASLTHSHAVKADEQWLYLPALKRVKRISSKNKSGPFMGSEFAFEDISSQEVDKYTYEYLGEDEIDGIKVYKIESKPAYKHSGYTRLINWIDQDRMIALKVEYFDRKNAPLKILTFSDHQQYLDKFWRAGTLEMINLQTKKSTLIKFSDYQFKTGLTDKDFNSSALKRLR